MSDTEVSPVVRHRDRVLATLGPADCAVLSSFLDR